MNKQAAIRIARHFEVFVEDQVAAGRYESASQVVEEGLRLLEKREAKVEALRQALVEGEESGVAEDFSFDAWLEERLATPGRDETA